MGGTGRHPRADFDSKFQFEYIISLIILEYFCTQKIILGKRTEQPKKENRMGESVIVPGGAREENISGQNEIYKDNQMVSGRTHYSVYVSAFLDLKTQARHIASHYY